MNPTLINQVLLRQIESRGSAEITVVGTSMNPTFEEGDIISVEKSANYEVGDILVFMYKSALLVHRLLRKGNRYFCKGDNAFRLEDVSFDEFIGKVSSVNGKALEIWPEWKIRMSYAVNREFFRCRYDAKITRNTSTYKCYEKAVLLGKEEYIMTYKKNENMDYIQTDETSLAVFDPESGDTHFFDETGIDILNTLNEPCNLHKILEKLCAVYDVKPEDIEGDVEEFLSNAVKKRVVEII